MANMGLLYDLENISRIKITVNDIIKLNKRGVYPTIQKGEIKGFEDENGCLIISFRKESA